MAKDPDILLSCSGFEWDEYNANKNLKKHGVSPSESEEIFFNRPLIVADDQRHSREERRFYALGQTDRDRKLFAVFTVRGDNIRVISARDMSRKEREVYESHEEESA